MTADAGAPAQQSIEATSVQSERVRSDKVPDGMLVAIGSGLVAIGLFFGMGGPLWPDVLDAYGVSKSQFGVMSGAGLALSLPILLFGSRITQAGGKFTVLLLAMLLLAVSSVAIAGLSGGLMALAGVMIVRGFGIALVDLTANTLTIDAERITGRPLMGQLHATFSGGSIAGAAAVAVALAVGLSYRSLYGALAVALAALALIFVLPMRPHDRVARTRSGSRQPFQFRLALSSPLIILCGLLTALSFGGEVIVADWTALYLRDERGVASSFAAACIVAFAVAMLFGRLLNGRLIFRFGVRGSIMLQGLISAVGGALIIIEATQYLAMVGCAVAGFGLAGIGPTALSVAGISLPKDPASAAGVTLAGGYIGLAATPVISGFVADGLSTRVTLSFVVVVGLACVVAARRMPLRLYEGS